MVILLRSQGAERFNLPLNLQVSQASAAARAAVEAAGGSVTTVYYNKLGASSPCSCALTPSFVWSGQITTVYYNKLGGRLWTASCSCGTFEILL